jgi:hypothetical protein
MNLRPFLENAAEAQTSLERHIQRDNQDAKQLLSSLNGASRRAKKVKVQASPGSHSAGTPADPIYLYLDKECLEAKALNYNTTTHLQVSRKAAGVRTQGCQGHANCGAQCFGYARKCPSERLVCPWQHVSKVLPRLCQSVAKDTLKVIANTEYSPNP